MIRCGETYTNGGVIMTSTVNEEFHKRLKSLYPCVEDVTRLPQTWSTELRAPQLGFTSDNLCCYFRGGKRGEEDEKSAAAVRTEHFIPPSCLLYYFEIRWVSKGREGFMGLGLTTANAPLTKLPGWAPDSYGYHADDGNIFNNDGRGVPFGPTFTTGDVVGCGYNLVEGKCFFTKNGINLGKAFDDISGDLYYYPTVGLKTSGEEIEANFGQKEFMYDIEQDLRSLRKNMTITISEYPISDFASWQSTIHRLLQSWLIQNSYPKAAEAFTKSAKLENKADMQRLQIRNRIQQLVLMGRISEAIQTTNQLCPDLLQNNPNLLFALKCRQFIELISGAESDFQPIFDYANAKENAELSGNKALNGMTKIDLKGDHAQPMDAIKTTNTTATINSTSTSSDRRKGTNVDINGHQNDNGHNGCRNGPTVDTNCEKGSENNSTNPICHQELMEIDLPANTSNNNNNSLDNTNNHDSNSTIPACHNKSQMNGQQTINSSTNNDSLYRSLDCEVALDENKYSKLILFGQELFEFLQQLDKLYGKNVHNEKLLRDAVGLIAFANPRNSFLANLLDPKEREPISQLLNNSILKAEMGDLHRSPLEDVMNHLRKVVRLNDSYGSWLIDQLF